MAVGLTGLAVRLGAAEAALRLLFSISLGYPFALFYRYFLFGKQPYIIHLFHTFTGLWIAYFNFGGELYHSALCIVIQFLFLRLMGKTFTAVTASFLFQMMYLLIGYYLTATERYDIKWTMPHCVLTLKLIGFAFDYYDGGKEPSKLSKEQQQAALDSVPSFLEVLGFSYFYGGFLVGPQFTMKSYLSLASGGMTDVPGQRPNSVGPAAQRFGLGLFFVIIYATLGPYFPDDYLLTVDFLAQPFWYRCVYVIVWGKIMLYKYVCCWLLVEGVCILTGLGYNGTGEDGKPRWDGCANMKVWLYETTPLFTGTIASFNINTNAWVARHIFKRLKFLGSKLASQAATLLFLAVWHGFHSGYFVCFSLEFLIVIVEKQVLDIFQESPLIQQMPASPALKVPFYLVQQFIHWLCMGYPLVAFCLFTWDKWMKVYISVYFVGHVIFVPLLFVLPYLRKVLVPRKKEKKAE
ncbi:lysophospholipid acyltransferase 5 [Latimeria chalumnae]|uniref:lysophospholipid acyltransferase 5 n=1 Tax=Latimeria chalumnae TaxID=7897 RepID=UPI00313F2487